MRSLFESGWVSTSSGQVESEFSTSPHSKRNAAAASSIFITSRKGKIETDAVSLWKTLGLRKIQSRIREAFTEVLKEFETFRLNPFYETLASYGRALRVLSENCPVLDGDQPVGPNKAMKEAGRVVVENHIRKITGESICVADLDPETTKVLTFLGIWGLHQFSFDEEQNISKPFDTSLEKKSGRYWVEDRRIKSTNNPAERGPPRVFGR